MDPPVHNPAVPYMGYITGGFRAGRTVRIQGRSSPNANRVTINLLSGGNSSHDDIVLHLDIRFNENCIVRNSRSYGSWGAEERHGHFTFDRGQHFEVMILSDPAQFRIAGNGSHLAEFNHRVPVDRISYIGVEGDATLTLIQFDGAGAPPSSGGGYAASAPALVGAPPPYPSGGAGVPGFVAPPYPPAGGSPYPPAGGSPYPPAGGSAYPPAGNSPYPQAAGYASGPPPPAYGAAGYPPPHGGSPYQQGPPTGSPYPQQQQGYAPGPYPTQPGYGPPPGGQPGYGYPPAYAPTHQKGGGGLLDNAGKLLAGGLAGVGLAKVANKIPGMGGGHGYGGGHHGYPAQHGHGHSGGGGGLGGALGTAAALGATGLVANKAMKKGKKNKLLKYGLPAAGLGIGGYAVSKGLKKGFHGHGHGSSSSSSSSSEEE